MRNPPAVNIPPAVLWLAVLLAAVHGVRLLLSEDTDLLIVLGFAFIPARYGVLGAQLPGGVAAWFWSPFTYAFLHADAVHLGLNLVWMAIFGGALARRFGTMRFLGLALMAAAAGAALHYIVHSRDVVPVIGASGSVSGMMAGAARFAFAPGGPLHGGSGRQSYRLPAEPLTALFTRSHALAFVIAWFAINLLFGIVGGLVPGVSGSIAWEAHIGGFLAGLLIFPLLDPVRSPSSGNVIGTRIEYPGYDEATSGESHDRRADPQ
jgi:membrane associated rhomboid family serine protease